jgi:hypothetical protein
MLNSFYCSCCSFELAYNIPIVTASLFYWDFTFLLIIFKNLSGRKLWIFRIYIKHSTIILLYYTSVFCCIELSLFVVFSVYNATILLFAFLWHQFTFYSLKCLLKMFNMSLESMHLLHVSTSLSLLQVTFFFQGIYRTALPWKKNVTCYM